MSVVALMGGVELTLGTSTVSWLDSAEIEALVSADAEAGLLA